MPRWFRARHQGIVIEPLRRERRDPVIPVTAVDCAGYRFTAGVVAS
jgi:hypothetical protein